MESAAEPVKSRSSLIAVVLAALLLPPLGLVLIWLRKGTETGKKVLATVFVTLWGAAYAYLVFGSGLFFRPQPNWEAHYAQLEQQRAEQKTGSETPAPNLSQTSTNSNSAATANSNSSTPSGTAPETARHSANYWTSYRGPGRDGRYDESQVRTDWPAEGLPSLWKQPVGGGYASFVVANGTAFTIEQRRNQEVVAAYDLRTGKELWNNAWDAQFSESLGGPGPRATPAWDNGRIYALGATGEFRCIDAKTGKTLWARNILKENGAQNLIWGMSASPLIVDDKVIVLPGGRSASVVAYNKVTGGPVWKSLSDAAAYCSPMLVTLAGKRQILAMTADRTIGVDPGTGELLWEYPWKTYQGISAAQPIVLDERRVFVSAGYGKGAALLEVNDTSDGMKARAVWENNSMKNKFNSSVLHAGYVYGLDEGILTCLNAESGERRWKGGRYGYGQVTLASNHVIVTTEEGEVVLVRATPERHEEVARFKAVEGKTWNCPAISGGLLLVRNETQMACFDLALK